MSLKHKSVVPSVQKGPDHSSFGEAHRKLDQSYSECQTAGWDGYGADIVTPQNLVLAHTFLDWVESQNLPLPDIGPENHGSFEFEWGNQNSRLAIGLKHKIDNGHEFDTLTFACILPEMTLGEDLWGSLHWHSLNLGYIKTLVQMVEERRGVKI